MQASPNNPAIPPFLAEMFAKLDDMLGAPNNPCNCPSCTARREAKKAEPPHPTCNCPDCVRKRADAPANYTRTSKSRADVVSGKGTITDNNVINSFRNHVNQMLANIHRINESKGAVALSLCGMPYDEFVKKPGTEQLRLLAGVMTEVWFTRQIIAEVQRMAAKAHDELGQFQNRVESEVGSCIARLQKDGTIEPRSERSYDCYFASFRYHPTEPASGGRVFTYSEKPMTAEKLEN